MKPESCSAAAPARCLVAALTRRWHQPRLVVPLAPARACGRGSLPLAPDAPEPDLPGPAASDAGPAGKVEGWARGACERWKPGTGPSTDPQPQPCAPFAAVSSVGHDLHAPASPMAGFVRCGDVPARCPLPCQVGLPPPIGGHFNQVSLHYGAKPAAHGLGTECDFQSP